MVDPQEDTRPRRSVSQIKQYERCPSEEWRRVGDTLYDVSDWGRVRSWHRGSKPRILKAGMNPVNGYPTVSLTWDGMKTSRTVHSLVALEFIGPRPEGMEVRHLNGDPSDCRLANLTYGTPKENQADRVIHGTSSNRGEQHPLSKLNYLKAKAIRTLYETDEFGYNDLAEVFNVKPRTIRKIIRGDTWRYETSSERQPA